MNTDEININECVSKFPRYDGPIGIEEINLKAYCTGIIKFINVHKIRTPEYRVAIKSIRKVIRHIILENRDNIVDSDGVIKSNSDFINYFRLIGDHVIVDDTIGV